MLAYAVREGRVFWLKPAEWSVLAIGVAFCGICNAFSLTSLVAHSVALGSRHGRVVLALNFFAQVRPWGLSSGRSGRGNSASESHQLACRSPMAVVRISNRCRLRAREKRRRLKLETNRERSLFHASHPLNCSSHNCLSVLRWARRWPPT